METKPIYRSKTFQGLIVALVALIIGKGADLDSAQAQSAADIASMVIQVLALAFAAYGRIKADTKITIGGKQ